MLWGDLLEERIELWSFEVHDVSLIKCCWVLYWTYFGTDIFHSAEKFTTGCHSRHENSSEFAHLPWGTSIWLPPCNHQLIFFKEKDGKPLFVCNAISPKLDQPATPVQELSRAPIERTLFQFIQRMNSNIQSLNQFTFKVDRIRTIIIWNWFALTIIVLVITLNVLLWFYYPWEQDQGNSDNCFKNIHLWSAKKDNTLSSFSNGTRWQNDIMKKNFKEIYTTFVMLAFGAPDHS